jgi:LysR family transcriptional regulator, glycine cleavage system transcriptional activator
MRRFVPSMSALQAFEAAGRLSSFALAAAELHVTPGAVSRQIKALEDFLGAELFTRLTRRIELTDAGRAYLREVGLMLDQLEIATRKFKSKYEHPILTVDVLPSIAAYWLMPKLGEFTRLHPEIEVRIVTSIRPVNLHAGEADLALRVGALPTQSFSAAQPHIDLQMVTSFKRIHADWLFPDLLVPVYSRQLVDHPISSPDELARLPLIHTSSRVDAWPGWFRSHGYRWMEPRETPIQYGHFFMSLEAARKGEGVALVPSILLLRSDIPDLEIASFSQIASQGDYYLLALEEKAQSKPIAALRDWLLQKAGEARSAMGQEAQRT